MKIIEIADYRMERVDLIQLLKVELENEDIKSDKCFECTDTCIRGHLFKIVKPGCEKILRFNSFPVR